MNNTIIDINNANARDNNQMHTELRARNKYLIVTEKLLYVIFTLLFGIMVSYTIVQLSAYPERYKNGMDNVMNNTTDNAINTTNLDCNQFYNLNANFILWDISHLVSIIILIYGIFNCRKNIIVTCFTVCQMVLFMIGIIILTDMNILLPLVGCTTDYGIRIIYLINLWISILPSVSLVGIVLYVVHNTQP